MTLSNSTLPDVIVHAADVKSTSLVDSRSTGSRVSTDDVTPAVQSPGGADRRPPIGAPVGRKLSASGCTASSSLPQLSAAVSGRQTSAHDETGSNNLSLEALHDAGLADAASRRQALIRSRACRPCHDLSKVTVDRPRLGSHFRLTAAVADVTIGCERTVTPDDHDRSSRLHNNIIVCDAGHRPQLGTQCPSATTTT